MRLNRNLALIAVVLLLASVWSYRSSISRADRFERGQRFLPNLNPDDVAEIAISKGAERVTLKRGEDGFAVTEIHGYPATNESVNRVLRSLVELELEKEVGTGDDLYHELGLADDSEGMIELALRGPGGSEMVHARFGTALEGGNGTYLRRLDGGGGPAYLSTSRVSINTSADSYLAKEIVNHSADEIESIDGRDYRVARTEDGLKLERVPVGREENPSAMSRIKGILSYLRFDEVFLADDERLSGLTLRQVADVRLTDGSGYRLALTERDGEHFLQISGYHTVNQVSVDRDESTEELEDKAAILSRADEIARFNRFHGLWVYRISKSTAEKLSLRETDLTRAGS